MRKVIQKLWILVTLIHMIMLSRPLNTMLRSLREGSRLDQGGIENDKKRYVRNNR